MTSRIRNIWFFHLSLQYSASTVRLISPLLLLLVSLSCSLGDGCFVFRWNKQADINEPTQKAIIVYDEGREDILLQVKYEGPLEDFGWLVPVPSLPVVEKGSMEPFYELSQLTQRRFGAARFGAAYGGGLGGAPDQVKVIEIKTVGAYEVAILAAQDAGSLSRWLESNGYSVPQGGSAVVDEYVRKGWYFVAARIQLNRDTTFRLVTSSSPKDSQAPTRARQVLEKQMASGELHPLRISFDTARCIFPLKISRVGGKPSEVSLYVLSAEPLLNKFIFDQRLAKLHQDKIEYESKANQRQEAAKEALQNSRRLHVAGYMYSLMPPSEGGAGAPHDWTLDDVDAIAAEGEQPTRLTESDDAYYLNPVDLLQTMPVSTQQIPKSAKAIERLGGKEWHLTKQVYSFRPEQMQDLEFQPAMPELAALLSLREGRSAGALLYGCGPGAVPVLLSGCSSTNSIERINASAALQSFKDERLVGPLLALLKDPVPDVRLNAVMATAGNWDPRFTDALFALLRDPHSRVRWQAAQWLTFHESMEQTARYLELLRDPDPGVPSGALQVLRKINPGAVTREELVRLLAVPNMEVVFQSLGLLQGSQIFFMRPGMAGRGSRQQDLSSLEVAPLTTNKLTLARLAGLKILYLNGDADAITLTLPLLRDTNAIVRNRAFGLLCTKTHQTFQKDDVAKWEEWWNANKATFKPGAS